MFKNGKELLESLENRNVDDISLIITDIEMPVMDGITMLEKITKNERYDGIPLLIHTNMANSAIRKKANDYNVKEVISKFNYNHLKDSIYKYIR